MNNMYKLCITSFLFIAETIMLFYFSIATGPSAQTVVEFNVGDILHVLGYLVYAILAERMLNYTRFKQHRWQLAFLIAVAVGGINEVLQSFIPGRYTDVMDFIYNAIGAVIGVLITFLFKKRE